MKDEWFGSWFDSPYYQLLYKHRDPREASRFLEALLIYINLPPGACVLDLACGRGRHSILLQKSGYQVTGLDYSPASIAEAQASSAGMSNIAFFVHDMRNQFPASGFHAIFNLFTSFGYFDTTAEHEAVLRNVHDALGINGWFVLDYLNPIVVEKGLVPVSHQEENGVQFDISRAIKENRVVKTIQVQDGDLHYTFSECVALFRKEDLTSMLHDAGFVIDSYWGDYNGNKYMPDVSPRMIFLCRKGMAT